MGCRSSLPIQMRANSMNDLEIRRARSDDAEAIADVHLDSRREALPWLPVLHSREETVTYFTDVLLREDLLVARRIASSSASSPSYAITSIIYISPQLISIGGSGINFWLSPRSYILMV
jgi:hypothetical protein